jgi:hypothetical protein
MEIGRERDVQRQSRMALLQAMFNAYGTTPRTASEMIEDAKSGLKKEHGNSVTDMESVGDDLKAAIIDYTNSRLDAQYFGNKLKTDVNRVTAGLRLCSEYDGHRKIMRYRAEAVRPSASS